MKKILLIAILISGLFSSQTYNFSIENNKVIWQKIYTTEKSLADIILEFQKSGNFNNIEQKENNTFLNFKSVRANYRDLGISSVKTSAYISNGKFEGSATVEFKEGKYRVIIRNIDYDFTYLSIATLKDTPEHFDIEQVALKNGNTVFKKGFIDRDMVVLDYTFNSLFDISKNKKPTEDW